MTQPGDTSGQGYWGNMSPPPPMPSAAAPPTNPYASQQSPYGAPPPPTPPQGFVPAWQQPAAPSRPAPTVSLDRMADVWGASIITLGVILLLLSMTVLSWVDTDGSPFKVTFGDIHTGVDIARNVPTIEAGYFGWGAILFFIVTALGGYAVRLTGSVRTVAAVLVAGLAFIGAIWTFFCVHLGFNVVKIVDDVGGGYYTALFGFVLIGLGTILPKHTRG